MKFCVTLGNGKHVTAKAYLNALHVAQANPTAFFNESFSGWGAYGNEIVKQHYCMLHQRHAAWNICGKGNRATKRAQRIRDIRAECKWCGQLTGAESKRFCSNQCARDYSY